MALTYTVDKDFKVIIKNGNKKIDVVGAFDSEESANLWGQAICDKYNSEEYAGIDYPNQKPVE